MSALVLLLELAVAGALQAVVPTAPWLGGMRAPLLLALVLHYALTRGRAFALTVALVAGLVQDALGLAPLGGSSFVFGAVALIAGRYRADVFHSAALLRAVLGAAASAAATLALWTLLTAAGHVRLPAGQGALRVFGAVVLGAAAAPIVGRVAEKVDQALGFAPAAGK
jgi:rod shape-determining protein MreD